MSRGNPVSSVSVSSHSSGGGDSSRVLSMGLVAPDVFAWFAVKEIWRELRQWFTLLPVVIEDTLQASLGPCKISGNRKCRTLK